MRMVVGGLLLCSLTACNRVPGNKVTYAPATDKMTASFTTALESRDDDEDGMLMPMCGRACGHWVSLRFPDPVGVDRVTPEERATVAEILDRQRALNRAGCEEACIANDDPRRARCILRAMTAGESEACALR